MAMTGIPNATALVGRAQMKKGPNRSLGLFKKDTQKKQK
jgi:hypothetical protein